MPIFIRQFSLSLSYAGFLGSFVHLMSSFLQPLFGVIADKRPGRSFVIFGPLIMGLFISLTAFAKESWQLIPLMVIASLGTAAFHPQATGLTGALVNHEEYQKRKRDHGMSIAKFIVFGTLAASFSSMLAYWLLGPENKLSNLLYSVPIALISASLVSAWVPTLTYKLRKPFQAEIWKAKAPKLVVLVGIVFVRSVVIISLFTFLPEYFFDEKSQTLLFGAVSILILHGANAIGSLLGSYMSKRIGDIKVLLINFIVALPLILVFVSSKFMPLLFLGGLVINLSQATVVSIAQKSIPENAATVSSLTMGFGFGLATLLMPLIGYFGDQYGLGIALEYTALIFLSLGIILVLYLRAMNKKISHKI